MSYLAPSRRRPWLKAIAALVALALIGWLVSLALRPGQPARKHEPPRITQVMLPPPPPPPPPKPEPEPPKEEKMVEAKPFEQLDPQPDKAPDTPDAPLTAAPGPGANNFGLQAGDGGGTRIGGKGGGGGSPFAGYAGMVQRAVQQFLQRDDKTRKGRYSATVAVWLNADGSIQRSQILTSAGKPELDAAIVRALQGQLIPQAPPNDLPQPINLRIGAIAPG